MSYYLCVVLGDTKFAVCVCLSVCWRHIYSENAEWNLAEILHNDAGLSRRLRLAF